VYDIESFRNGDVAMKKDDDINYSTNTLKDYLLQLKEPLTSQEEERLFIQLQNGDSSVKDVLIERNLRLVVAVAKRFQNRGVELIDLIGYGTLGLIEAVSRFDVSKGFRFSTYAEPWIEKAIREGIVDSARIIRTPDSVNRKIAKYVRTFNNMKKDLGRNPTREEISIELGCSLETIETLECYQKDAIRFYDVLYTQEDELMDLEKCIGTVDVSLEEDVYSRVLRSSLLDFLENELTEREVDILKLRYGYFNNRVFTLEEITKKYHLTKEGIRSIENQALRHLRETSYIKGYAVFLDDEDSALESLENMRKKDLQAIKRKTEYYRSRKYHKKIHELVITEEFEQLSSLFDYENACIVYLSIHKIPSDLIGQFLNIEEKQVLESLKQMISLNWEQIEGVLKEIKPYQKKKLFKKISFSDGNMSC